MVEDYFMPSDDEKVEVVADSPSASPLVQEEESDMMTEEHAPRSLLMVEDYFMPSDDEEVEVAAIISPSVSHFLEEEESDMKVEKSCKPCMLMVEDYFMPSDDEEVEVVADSPSVSPFAEEEESDMMAEEHAPRSLLMVEDYFMPPDEEVEEELAPKSKSLYVGSFSVPYVNVAGVDHNVEHGSLENETSQKYPHVSIVKEDVSLCKSSATKYITSGETTRNLFSRATKMLEDYFMPSSLLN